MGQILDVIHLVRHFGRVRAVDDVSFSIDDGQIFGLLGPNGAGKSTIINIICQALRADSGTVLIGGREMERRGHEIKQVVGVVPQELALYPSISGLDNLRFFGGLYGLGGSELRARIGEALELVGLAEHARRPVGNYSGGMKRRLNIAAGLLHRPRLLLLDEPAVGVDPQSRNHILESIERLTGERRMAILYTSHYMDEVERLCNRVAIIDRGKIIADDSVERLIDRQGGGAILLRLQKSEGLDQEAVTRALAEVAEVRRSGDGEEEYVLSVENPQRSLPGVFDALGRCGARLDEMEIRRASLETVFLNLTGRSLRDE